MKKEYDFSKATKGKFYRPADRLEVPIYLDKEVAAKLRRQSKAGPAELSRIVNRILRKEIELIDMLGK